MREYVAKTSYETSREHPEIDQWTSAETIDGRAGNGSKDVAYEESRSPFFSRFEEEPIDGSSRRRGSDFGGRHQLPRGINCARQVIVLAYQNLASSCADVAPLLAVVRDRAQGQQRNRF